ncbi:uncharacterized protein LOC114308568 [Camellia sinensis]|uniref:uncharacterized protein LOC114308568 n=1 Tax=Camellia sinensis TaxID=4442 RepID=UPI001035BAE1|nr:uncharacterized protein LOC114308568 [Camellia sinensis]
MRVLAREMDEALRESMDILRDEQAARTIEGETRVLFLKKDFFHSNLAKFLGGAEPLKADEWLEQITKPFEILDIRDGELRVALATREHLQREFEKLEQSDSIVAEFEATFMSLSHFAPDLLGTEERRCLEFEKRLRLEILMKMMENMIRDYDRLVESAAHVEILLEGEEKKRRLKRQGFAESRGSSMASKKSMSSTSSHVSSSPIAPSKFMPRRSTDGTGQNGITCYQCGEKGHKLATCPQKGNQQRQFSTHSQNLALGGGQSPVYYQCGQSGHMKKFCPQFTRMTSASGFQSDRARDRLTS